MEDIKLAVSLVPFLILRVVEDSIINMYAGWNKRHVSVLNSQANLVAVSVASARLSRNRLEKLLHFVR
jgi:hypothetical protein